MLRKAIRLLLSLLLLTISTEALLGSWEDVVDELTLLNINVNATINIPLRCKYFVVFKQEFC